MGHRNYLNWINESFNRQSIRFLNLGKITFDNDVDCFDNIRMDKIKFYKLCEMLKIHCRLQEN